MEDRVDKKLSCLALASYLSHLSFLSLCSVNVLWDHGSILMNNCLNLYNVLCTFCFAVYFNQSF